MHGFEGIFAVSVKGFLRRMEINPPSLIAQALFVRSVLSSPFYSCKSACFDACRPSCSCSCSFCSFCCSCCSSGPCNSLACWNRSAVCRDPGYP